MNNANSANFSYSVFDRQLNSLINMSQVLIGCWEDYTTAEMNCDISSLRIKAARLCYMADIDFSLQQEDFNRQRQEQNLLYLSIFNTLIHENLTPLLRTIVNKVRNGQSLQGHSSPTFPITLSKVLPHISETLLEDGMTPENLEHIQKDVESMEKILAKKGKTNLPSARPEERMLALLQYFALLCYLLFHFEKVSRMHQAEIAPEETSRLFTQDILLYTESPSGKEELERFRTALEFDYDGEMLTESQLKEVRRKIRDAIPVSLQTAFMKHANHPDALAQEITRLDISLEDYTLLIDGMAKWQLLGTLKEEHEEKESFPSTLYNTIFRTSVNGSKVNLLYIREVISRMLPKITKKNHWFCVWCVLKHRNLLATQEHEAFAVQMQHQDWFPDLESYKSFTGATLNDYNGYLSQTDFMLWNEEDYEEFRNFHHVPKQSQGLLKKFKTLCIQLDAAFGGR